MPAFKSSRLSRVFELAAAFALASTLAVLASWWFFSRGESLAYGDAASHLNIARRITDSRTPGYSQIGTVWLPLPHLIVMPLAERDEWWRSGIAGVVPSTAAFVLSAVFLFTAARRAFSSAAAGFAALALYTMNPNLMYLQATPMTEPLMLMFLTALLYATVRFHQTQSMCAVAAAGLAALGGIGAAPFLPVQPLMGDTYQTQGLITVVIGGMGSYIGAFVGAMILGMARAFGDYFALKLSLSPAIAEASTVIIMVIVLLTRPQGLFGKKE